MDQTQLTITDLSSLLQIVEAASQRGAFKATELSQVGAVYDKLSAFLAASKAATTPTITQTQGEANA